MLNDPPGAKGRALYVAQGEIIVDSHPDTVISKLLGSCVSVCLHDPVARIGAMNHILLPDDVTSSASTKGAAVHAMELLLNPMMRQGAIKNRIQAKIFGGASFSGVFGDIGNRNIEFVMRFLEDEGIECVGKSVGGRSARRVKFWPESGRAQQKLVKDEPIELPDPIDIKPEGGLELF